MKNKLLNIALVIAIILVVASGLRLLNRIGVFESHMDATPPGVVQQTEQAGATLTQAYTDFSAQATRYAPTSTQEQ